MQSSVVHNILLTPWNPEVECWIHKGSPILPILSRTNTIPRIVNYLIKIHSNIVLPSTLRTSFRSLTCKFPVRILKAFLPTFILARWPAHLNCLDLIIMTILGEQYKLWSSSLWSFLPSPFSSLLVPNTRHRILFSNTQPALLP